MGPRLSGQKRGVGAQSFPLLAFSPSNSFLPLRSRNAGAQPKNKTIGWAFADLNSRHGKAPGRSG
ncbi:hypothetical protein DWY99_03325 [[Clostridium] leptum]|uniref:Uncharacterized protein n=1 Tax=[Clostridium] leptum TaxID=1535 RepID=A0A412AZ95_9FIRM|nr:hypothetical protein DWY99_03325 [[Clostridium] leptum]